MYVTFCCVSKSKNEPTEGESPPEGDVTTVNGGLTVQRYDFFSDLSIVCLYLIVFYSVFIDLYQL